MNLPTTCVNGPVVLEGVCVILIYGCTLLQCTETHASHLSASHRSLLKACLSDCISSFCVYIHLQVRSHIIKPC